MTNTNATERLLAAWLEAEAPPRAPAGLRDDILTATSRIRPRPAWVARLRENPMDVIVGGRAGRSPYQRFVPVLIVLGLLMALAVGAAIVGSRLLTPAPAPSISRVPFNEPLFQVIFADDGTTWASTASETPDGFRVTGIHRVDPGGATTTPVVTDLPSGHVSFVVLDSVIWASNDESGTWHTWNAETGAKLGSGDLGRQPLEPITAFGSVWQGLYGTDEVLRVAPRTGEILRIRTAHGPRALVAGADHLWAFHPDSGVKGIDPGTNTVSVSFRPSSQTCGGSVAGGRVWVFYCSGAGVAEVFETDGSPALTYRSDAIPWFAFDYDGDVWTVESTPESRTFANGELRTIPGRTRVVRLDPATLAPLTTYDLGEGVGVNGRSDTVTGSLDSDALWLVQGTDVIRIPLAALPERPNP